MTSSACEAVVVLAAGKGTRMRSRMPKVLHAVAGRSLLGHALAAVTPLLAEELVVVVRQDRDLVADHVRALLPQALVADQDETPGTGQALRCGLDQMDERRTAAGVDRLSGRVLVTYGDVPLLRTETLRRLLAADPGAAVTLLSAEPADPTGYGRVVRDADGEVARIVEQRDADKAELAVTEVNSGVYVLDLQLCREVLPDLGAANEQGEVYLTDVVARARARGGRVTAVRAKDPHEVDGVNDRVQLAAAGARLHERLLHQHMLAGVGVVDPATTYVGADVTLEPDVTLLPGTHLSGRSHVAEGAVVGPDTSVHDSVVREGARVTRSHLEGADIGQDAVVGPFSYCRPGTVLGPRGKIGAYVETKSARIGAGSKVPHLSYVGDAEIGEGSNIGAASVFVNYDGEAKHRTVVGDQVRIGSDTMLVAPVTVGDGAYTAAGSVITDDVPPGALAVARARQHVSEGWVARRRPGSASAAAAAAEATGPGTTTESREDNG